MPCTESSDPKGPQRITRRECSICGAEVRGNVWTCNHVYTDPEPSGDPHRVTTTRVNEIVYERMDSDA